VAAKRALIEPEHPQLRLRRQCALLGLARSGVYDQPVGDRAEDLPLMRWLDAHYTATPCDGVRRMTAWLRRQGDAVHPKHIRRLRRQMGLEAISPQPQLSQPAATRSTRLSCAGSRLAGSIRSGVRISPISAWHRALCPWWR
jgi:putative transposase